MGLEVLNQSAPADTEEKDTAATSVAAKAPTTMGKGNYLSALPAATIGGAIPTDLLKTMEQMVAEREKQKNSLTEAMRDATAWWSGGVAGPGEALRQRAAEREGFDATTFGMKSALAQYKAAQDATANRAQSLQNAIGGGGAPAAGGAPTGGAVSMPPAVSAEINRLLSLRPPDVAGAEALRMAWAKNESKFDAARHTQQTYYINPEIGNVNMDPEQASRFKQTGILPDGRRVNMGGAAPEAAPSAAPAAKTSAALPHTQPIQKVSAPSETPVSSANILGANANIAKDAGIPVISGYRPNEKQAQLKAASEVPGYSGPPVAAPGKSLHQTDEAIDVDFKNLKPEQKKWLKDNGYVQTMPDTDPNHFAKLPLISKTSAAPAVNVPNVPSQRAELVAAKTTSPEAVNLPYPVPRNSKEVEANQEYMRELSKKKIEIQSKGPEKAGTEAGTRRAQMFKLNEDADLAIEAANQVIAASKTHPESTGIGKGFTGANALVTIAGAVVPKMDKAKAEEEYADLMLNDEASAARSQIDTASKQLGITFAADVFKGARMGIGLENMAAGAKGVSVHNRAENNIINATLIKEAALFNKERARLFKDEWAPKNGGDMADFEKFETSPEYIALREKTQKRIADSLPQYLKLGKNGLEQTKAGKEIAEAAAAEPEKAAPSKFDKFKKKKAD